MIASRILIVEDDPLWQNLLQEPLEDEYILTVVSSRSEAKTALDTAKIAGAPYNVVTVDIGLAHDAPSLEGEDILDFVSQHHRGTKCIVVTGHESVNTTRLRNYFKEYDVFDFIGKADFNIVRFKEIVDKAFYLHGYRILAELGRGGMGIVYKARDPENDNRIVALKVMHHDSRLSSDEAARRLVRFSQEVETARRLMHPNIVTMYDYVASEDPEDQVFLVMEYLHGPTLDSVLNTKTHLSQSEVIEIGLQLCEALAYAHQQQVIHRDIKPSNIILLSGNEVKITDFGIAKVLDADFSLTRTEEIIGTPDYMPPEQILHAKMVDHRVDIYAAGALLYEMLSGQKLYTNPIQKLQYDPTPLQDIIPNLPESLTHIIMKALARNPDDRYQTADEMAKALEDWRLE